VLWPDERYRNDDVRRENLVDTKFGDYSLPCPRNADKYLDATYGEDWRKTGRSQSYNHITRENQGRSIMILGHFIGNSIRYISCNLQVASVYFFGTTNFLILLLPLPLSEFSVIPKPTDTQFSIYLEFSNNI
jgi:hypothetical protein